MEKFFNITEGPRLCKHTFRKDAKMAKICEEDMDNMFQHGLTLTYGIMLDYMLLADLNFVRNDHRTLKFLED